MKEPVSEKVKIVVELSKGQYEHLKDIQYGGVMARIIFNEVVKGTPLSEVLTEIKEEIEELKVICGCQGEDEKEIFDWAVDEALEIIDKHIHGEGDKKDQ